VMRRAQRERQQRSSLPCQPAAALFPAGLASDARARRPLGAALARGRRPRALLGRAAPGAPCSSQPRHQQLARPLTSVHSMHSMRLRQSGPQLSPPRQGGGQWHTMISSSSCFLRRLWLYWLDCMICQMAGTLARCSAGARGAFSARASSPPCMRMALDLGECGRQAGRAGGAGRRNPCSRHEAGVGMIGGRQARDPGRQLRWAGVHLLINLLIGELLGRVACVVLGILVILAEPAGAWRATGAVKSRPQQREAGAPATWVARRVRAAPRRPRTTPRPRRAGRPPPPGLGATSDTGRRLSSRPSPSRLAASEHCFHLGPLCGGGGRCADSAQKTRQVRGRRAPPARGPAEPARLPRPRPAAADWHRAASWSAGRFPHTERCGVQGGAAGRQAGEPADPPLLPGLAASAQLPARLQRAVAVSPEKLLAGCWDGPCAHLQPTLVATSTRLAGRMVNTLR